MTLHGGILQQLVAGKARAPQLQQPKPASIEAAAVEVPEDIDDAIDRADEESGSA